MRLRARQHRRNGFVLVVVLGLVLLLSVLLFGFNHKTLIRLDTAESFREFEQALHCARAGLGIAMAAIRDANDLSDNPRFAKLRTGQETFSVGDGTCSVTITGADGRLNVNRLKSRGGRLDRRRIEQLLRLIDLINRDRVGSEHIGYSLVPALIDWIDQDDEITQLPFVNRDNQGAENRYYATLTPAYPCRNRPMDTIEELYWVKGVTPEAFAILRDLLTTVGEGRININTAPRLVIECLSEQMDPVLTQVIIQQREVKPFRHVAELKEVPGMTDNVYETIRDTITTGSDEQHYRVSTRGKVGDRICEIEALLRRNSKAGNVDIIQYRES
ncbi:MAG: type II secretion system minor pseudopilin GspK [Phycisphaerales bacterium]|nr:MAG: type II secretion system minor pseudopilin GspK [Phycisphaerales bacterium]